MMRVLACLAATAVTMLCAAVVQAAPMLRPVAVVQGTVIHLGDLFTDAGAHAGDPLIAAPPPGARTIFDAAWLAAVAREHGLAWQPASPFDQASVERASRVIPAEAVQVKLLDEIAARQKVDGDEIQLDNTAVRMVVAAETPDSIAIEGLTLDARTGRFSALVSAPADDADADRQRISGRLVHMMRLPVLTHPVAPGDSIRASDIEILIQRADRVAADVIGDLRDIVGKTPRRPLRAHEPLRVADVQVPAVVRKGDLVTIVLETSQMRLTAQGKALEDGGMGAAIRIVNTKSGRAIDAVVTGPNLAAVAAAPQLAAR
jgi:flagellar basal body P-ring formation protein FlgA